MPARVLVIEDNGLNLELVTVLLEGAGHQVSHAGTAEEGIERARKDRPDLILLDIRLPGMDGHAAVGILKKDPNTTHIPVIALTAQAMKGDETRALEAGFDGYISKPIDTRAFGGAISLILQKGGAA